MKKVLLTLLSFLVVSAYAQKENEYFNPKEAFNKASELLSEEKHDEAIELLQKIEKNDSIYMSSLISEMYIYMLDEKYDKAIALADANIGKDYNYDYYFLLNKSVSYLRQDKYQQSMEVLKEMRERYPYNYLVEFNIGVCFEKLEQKEEAVQAYQRCISLNPYYQSVHLSLGRICYEEDKLAQAILCYNTYLMINPSSDNALANLSILNKMVSEKNTNEPEGIESIAAIEMYDEIDLLLKNYVSLNKKYKVKNKVRLPFVKQNHFLLSNLSEIEGDGSFWDTKYLKFYKALMKEGHFDGFIYRLTSAASSDKYVSIVAKNEKKVDAFVDWAGSKWSEIVSKENVNLKGEKEKRFWYSNDGDLQAVGDVDDQGRSQGEWTFYGDNGDLKSKGSFVDDERNGRWEWYYGDGSLKEYSHYSAGNLNGETKTYSDNGKLRLHVFYKNDSVHGKYLKYNKFGALPAVVVIYGVPLGLVFIGGIVVVRDKFMIKNAEADIIRHP